MSDSTSPPPPSLFTPANLLTAARIFLLPVAVYGIAEERGWLAVGAMVAAWLTDLADGYAARRRQVPTALGRTLDTAVDFTLIFGLFLAFYVAGWIPSYQFFVLYFAKLLTFLLEVSALAARGWEPLATRLSKLAGVLAYAYLAVLAARLLLPASPLLPPAQLMIFAALTLAVLLNGTEWLRAAPRPV
jgi:cardiolipin synthase